MSIYENKIHTKKKRPYGRYLPGREAGIQLQTDFPVIKYYHTYQSGNGML